MSHQNYCELFLRWEILDKIFICDNTVAERCKRGLFHRKPDIFLCGCYCAHLTIDVIASSFELGEQNMTYPCWGTAQTRWHHVEERGIAVNMHKPVLCVWKKSPILRAILQFFTSCWETYSRSRTFWELCTSCNNETAVWSSIPLLVSSCRRNYICQHSYLTK